MDLTHWIAIGLFFLGHGVMVIYSAGRIVERLKSIEKSLDDGKGKMDGQQIKIDDHEHRLSCIETACSINHK